MPRSVVFVLLLCLPPFYAVAQKAEFRFYTVAEGMPQNEIYSVSQDTQGFVWANAGGNICRFDGEQFLSHVNSKHPVFNGDRGGFSEILMDGELLVHCRKEEVVSINTVTGKVSTVSLASSLPPGTEVDYGHCLQLGNGQLAAVYSVRASNKLVVFLLKKGQVDRKIVLDGVNEAKENFFFTFCGDGKGNFFSINDSNSAILKFDSNGSKLQEYSLGLSSYQIIRILPGQQHAVWVSIGNQLWKLEEGAASFHLHPLNANPLFQKNFAIYDLVETPEGNLWVGGTDRNLIFYDVEAGHLIDYQQELENLIQNQAAIDNLSLDKSGVLWAGTSLGLVKIMPKADLFDTYFAEKNEICGGYCSFRGFAEDGEGSVYASFYNNIFKISPDGASDYRHLMPTDNGPFDLFYHKGHLVLNNGDFFDLARMQRANANWQFGHNKDWGVFANDGKGSLWWAYFNQIWSLDEQGGTLAWKQISQVADQRPFTDIAFDPFSQVFWLGNEAAVWTFDPTAVQQKRVLENEPEMHFQLKCLYPDGKGQLWLGTEKGLVRFDYGAGTWKRFTQADGLPNDIVVGILPEGDSCLWISTFNGLSRFRIAEGRFLNFFEQDGLADNEFNRASFFKASNGRFFFGGTKGVTAFYPQRVMEKFTHLQAGEKLLLRSVSMTLAGSDTILSELFHDPSRVLDVFYQNKSLTIEFGLLGSSKDGHSLYSYLLDGQGSAWSTPSKNNTVTFNSLPSGRYVFRVKALDARGNWLPEEIAIRLHVHPPWWATWWAYTLYAFIIAGLAYTVFYFLKKRWELQNQLQLEQQEALRLKELDVFKSRLYTNLTPEFRTPLTVILGMADQLESLREGSTGAAGGTASGFDPVGLIKRNGQNLLRLVNQLLDLSKLEDRSFKLQIQHGDILPFLRYSAESFQSIAHSRKISLLFSSSLDRLDMDFDPEQVGQVVGNLLSNALKFTLAGGEVKLEVKRVGGPPSTGPAAELPALLLIVSDTGIGIPESALPHIFDRFYQVDSSATRAMEGTGIGLAHALELVKWMGGEIRVESQVGKGTAFTVRLPIAHGGPRVGEGPGAVPVPKPAIQPIGPMGEAWPEAGPADSPSLPQVLIVEDNPDVVVYLHSILSPNYGTDIAYNGRAGIEKALERIPDLVISDVMMPERDGYQLLDTLKNDERTSHIPILLLTAKVDAESRLAGLRRGADAFLPKPFDKAELLTTIAMVMENRRRMVLHFSSRKDGPGTQGAMDAPQDGLVPAARAEPNADLAMEDAFIQKVRRIVAEQFGDENFALPQLCLEIGMSRSQLFRKMKALTDESPSDFIRKYRMEQAKILLETTQLSVKEVAFKVGFKDLPHFSRTFQETYGIPPSMAGK